MGEEEEGQYTKPLILDPLKAKERILLGDIETYAV